MTNTISTFYWNANKDNCIAVLNYELQGSASAEDNTWHNDACPSATLTLTDTQELFFVFFPSDYDDKSGESLNQFHIFNSEDEHLASYLTIGEVITFFQSVI